MLYVDSGLYFVEDKNNFINPLLQVGSGSVEKSTGSGSESGGPKITGSDRIRILIPSFYPNSRYINMAKLVPISFKIHISSWQPFLLFLLLGFLLCLFLLVLLLLGAGAATALTLLHLFLLLYNMVD